MISKTLGDLVDVSGNWEKEILVLTLIYLSYQASHFLFCQLSHIVRLKYITENKILTWIIVCLHPVAHF